MFNFIVCGVFKNEAHILSEWIRHYLSRGVDHIYLVNDHSTDDFMTQIAPYSEKVTLFHNDIVTRDVGRQELINNKYFGPLLANTKWIAVLDLDEFLYSPTDETFAAVLERYDRATGLKIDWLHFGSSGHIEQPRSVVEGFTKRAEFRRGVEYYAFKTIAKAAAISKIEIHGHRFRPGSNVIHLEYSDDKPPPLVINHYTIQSYNFFMTVKATRGDINNWFDHVRKSRNEAMFRSYDKNEVTDLRLLEQNKEPDEVTLVITSCNRPALLKRTLESFMAKNTYPIKQTFVIDDSGKQGCNDAVLEPFLEPLRITNIYNPVNIGQVASIDKVYSYVTTKWIFHCEEDWVFLQPRFIEKSMTVFRENPDEKIYTVWLRPHGSTSGHPIMRDSRGRGYYEMKRDYSYEAKGVQYIWGGITFNPGLRKTADCMLLHPYSARCESVLAKGASHVTEYTINKAYVDRGYYAMILADPAGHVNHIGAGHHIPNAWD